MLIENMLIMDDQIAEEWKNPPKGFSDDLLEDTDQPLVITSIEHINSLLNNFGYQYLGHL